MARDHMGDKDKRIIAARLQRSMDGQGPQMLAEALREALSIPQQAQEEEGEDEMDDDLLTDHQVASILRKIGQGLQSQALKVLTPTRLAPPSAMPTWQPDSQSWVKALQHMKKAKAFEPGGWSHEAIQSIANNPATAGLLQQWVQEIFHRNNEQELLLALQHAQTSPLL